MSKNKDNTLKFNRVATLALAHAAGIEVHVEQDGSYLLVLGETQFVVSNLQAIVVIATGSLANQERINTIRERVIRVHGTEKADAIFNGSVEVDEGNVETYLESLSKIQPQPSFHGRPKGNKNKTPAA